ncbi:phosphoglycerate mutase,2,3-biphosphateglycerate-independent type [Natronomonas moolapensis 8.8.11]|uniref:2,3-bisphosphoglycerate-independent phosphoglycerate mutase n=1 Tax=Natronomonas moolapensis (strain DSM 18674 / CECT 7526 / JCM 14361 / 8.8.11) TaxID=268739 RepID=M1XQK1_NATM8|nr:2,3-bisphosphoglycerate-independent phosphoglycerate mutase [Natronomonas moolapensis]CCQ36377.1 phosphoglycerate mutase,2,3-biphosphateglycerate-independent type [Natronomonas moolapensis 8.8.11]
MQAALVILDGWGLGDGGEGDAVSAAATPTVDHLRDAGAYGTLETHGRRVGLPDGQMGNSEVGHLNIGAGRVLKQDSTRVTDDIDAGVFADNEAIGEALSHADDGGRVHFLGLVSDGGVHSYQAHLHALIELAAEQGVEAVTHVFTDGRDTAPEGGVGFLADLEATVEANGTGHVGTVCGRYYAMDRDGNWARTKRAYDAIVEGEAPHAAASAVEAVEASYDRGETDEYVEPTLIEGAPPLSDGDAAVFFNFRADRARQLTRMLADIDPEWAVETDPPEVELVTMTEYDETFGLPVAYPPLEPERTLGEALAEAGRTQLRAAESEKYAHVTYFLNGGRETAFDGEYREIVPSPDVPTYDERPEMSAAELTDTAIDAIERGVGDGETAGPHDLDVLVLNYANPDMVGHSGDFDAAVSAVEAVDTHLARLEETVRAAGGHLFVTADHGNADDMGTPEDPHTAHTTNPVPFVYLAPDGTDGDRTVRPGGTLADIAPTLLSRIDVEVPGAMTGDHLLE